ncbi:MAG TPA: F0F1 ATP synthase subunit A [Candidatus Saccharimonadales bacterium]|nr:F0F1 ATP synthase subunit A [Candidatus Saccharimonadales bacterium]
MIEQAGEGVAAAGAAAHAAQPVPEKAIESIGQQIAHTILHHVTNSNELELPFIGSVHLPHLELFGIDLSITKHVVMMWVVAVLLLLLFGLASRRRSLVPTGLANVLEAGVVFVRDEIAVKTLGEKDGRRLSPYLLTVFFFILFCNLLGLVPYGASATGNINVTGALALGTLVLVQVEGIRSHGFAKHFKHMIPGGLPAWLFPVSLLIFFLELLGFIVLKPFALMVRLFANMTAGHVAILAFISVTFALHQVAAAPLSIGFALFVSTLELLVALIQAYVFTILTSLFVGLTLHPAH